jgi:hypothetical protein
LNEAVTGVDESFEVVLTPASDEVLVAADGDAGVVGSFYCVALVKMGIVFEVGMEVGKWDGGGEGRGDGLRELLFDSNQSPMMTSWRTVSPSMAIFSFPSERLRFPALVTLNNGRVGLSVRAWE